MPGVREHQMRKRIPDSLFQSQTGPVLTRTLAFLLPHQLKALLSPWMVSCLDGSIIAHPCHQDCQLGALKSGYWAQGPEQDKALGHRHKYMVTHTQTVSKDMGLER